MRNCPMIVSMRDMPVVLPEKTPGVVTMKLSVVRNITTAIMEPRILNLGEMILDKRRQAVVISTTPKIEENC